MKAVQRIFKIKLLFIGVLSVALLNSCDDRVPQTSTSDYLITLTTNPVAYDSNDNEIVIGEDILGNSTLTRATVFLSDTAGTPIQGEVVSFSAKLNGNSVGSFSPSKGATDKNGQVIAYYSDSNTAGDIAVTAKLNKDVQSTKTISVVDTSVTKVWPYYLNITPSNSSITLDGGLTYSDITAQVTNRNGIPVTGLSVNFSLTPADLGILSAGASTTDSQGKAVVRFSDTGNEEHIGDATIKAWFNHPFFGDLLDSTQVSIIVPTSYTLSVSSTPIAIDQVNSLSINVGEDVAGTSAYTLVAATLMDQNGLPIAGKNIAFNATRLSSPSGSFNVTTASTNIYGVASALFEDSGSAVDNTGTPTYEGIIATARLNDQTIGSTQFNVYADQTDVWPYRFTLNTDTDVIQLDNGVTKAHITIHLFNKLNKPLPNLEVAFDATRGYIIDHAITDSSGTIVVEFSDLGNPDDVGVSTITVAFDHPSFGSVSDSLQISIEDPSFSGTPAYIEIPPSIPNRIMVVGGGGRESTSIKAKVYDENGVLVDTPTPVVFTLGPIVPAGTNLNNAGLVDTAYTVNGIASVSLNSGTRPGPVRVTASVDVNDSTYISASRDNQAIVVTGPAQYIFPDTDPQSLQPIGGGMYRMVVAALVYDLWHNPVADTTHVYWSMQPSVLDADSVLDAFIEGVSFTGNTSIDGETQPGVAYTTVVYPSRDIFSVAQISALCFGGDVDGDGVYGDSVFANVENDVVMPYYAGTLTVTVNPAFWDFTINSNPAFVEMQATLIDYYSNPVQFGHLIFGATGAADLQPPNPLVTDANGQATVVGTFNQGICTPIPNSDPQTYNDFTATVQVTLIDPIGISSDPVEILFIRSPVIP